MNTFDTPQASCTAYQTDLHANMAEALEALRVELGARRPEALPLYELFVPWVYAAHIWPGERVNGRNLRVRFLVFPYQRLEELVNHAKTTTRIKGGTAAQRTAGFREVRGDLRELWDAFMLRDGRMFRRLALKALGIAAVATILILAPIFFFDVGSLLRAWFSR